MADVNVFLTEGTSQNSTPLTDAIFKSKYDEDRSLGEVRSLIQRGADVNMIDLHGWSPLIKAIWVQSHRIVQVLLDNGADPNWGDPRPLEAALNKKNWIIASILINAGAH